MTEFVVDTGSGYMLTLTEKLISLLQEWNTSLLKGEITLHRTPVEEVRGDVLDMLEVEMVNDVVAKEALSQVEPLSVTWDSILLNASGRGPVVFVPLDDPEEVSLLLMWLNTLYTEARKDEFTSNVVGVSQGDSPLEIDFKGMEYHAAMKLAILQTLVHEVALVWAVK